VEDSEVDSVAVVDTAGPWADPWVAEDDSNATAVRDSDTSPETVPRKADALNVRVTDIWPANALQPSTSVKTEEVSNATNAEK